METTVCVNFDPTPPIVTIPKYPDFSELIATLPAYKLIIVAQM